MGEIAVLGKMKDWRLYGRSDHLVGVDFHRAVFCPGSAGSWWSGLKYGHCELCMRPLVYHGEGSERLYQARSALCTSDGYYWVCDACFEELKGEFKWNISDSEPVIIYRRRWDDAPISPCFPSNDWVPRPGEIITKTGLTNPEEKRQGQWRILAISTYNSWERCIYVQSLGTGSLVCVFEGGYSNNGFEFLKPGIVCQMELLLFDPKVSKPHGPHARLIVGGETALFPKTSDYHGEELVRVWVGGDAYWAPRVSIPHLPIGSSLDFDLSSISLVLACECVP